MGSALELIVIPVLLMLAIIIIGVSAEFSIGAVIVGGLVVALIGGLVIGFLRSEKHLEEDEGVGDL